MDSRSIVRKLAALTVALALTLAGGSAALAQSDEPVVLAASVPAAGQLAGSGAGSFAYYSVAYTGDDESLEIELTTTPRDPAYAQGIGFNVYGPDDWQGSGTWVDDDGVTSLSYAAEDAATLLVQVYNYTDVTVSYDLVATGAVEAVAAAEASTATEAATTAAETATVTEVATTTPLSATGALLGQTSGAYAQHALGYAGDETEVVVTMYYTPADPSFNGAFGFMIYSPSGEVVAVGESTDTLGEFQATVATDEAGAYLVQVYNYTDGVMLNYTLTVSQ